MRRSETKSGPVLVKEPTSATNGSRFPAWLIAILLALATIALYWPATQCDFVSCDDPKYVSENPHVQAGLTWQGVKWAFGNTEQGAYWAPLMWLSHELACQIFGLDPWGHHLINVLLHAANTALVFLVFRRMTGAVWRSLMLAALFGWHPLRVESVAWVTERKDVLSGLFWMLTLLAYARYVESTRARDGKSKAWYGAAFVMFACGLMSKAMLVTLPCALLLLDYWPLGRVTGDGWRVTGIGQFQRVTGDKWQVTRIRQLVLEKIPFFLLAAAAGVVTFIVQRKGGAVITFENLPLGARVGNALVSYCRYLEKMFWPRDLAVFYPHPGYWPMEQALLAGVFVCAFSVFLFLKRGRYPFLLVGWLWFLGTLVPVIQLVQSGEQAMADRFTYVPSLGVLMLVIWGAYEITRGWRAQAMVLSVAGSLALAVCLALTWRQIGYWKDSETLYRHALAVTKNNYMVTKALGDVLLKKGQINKAITQYEEAIRLKPDYAEAHYNLGVAFAEKGQTAEAISQYQEAIGLQPDYADAHFNLGIALFNNFQTREAIEQFQAVVRLKPDDADARINLGDALFNDGQTDAAISQFQEVLRLKPGDPTAQGNLAKALESKNKASTRPPESLPP